MFRLFLVSFLAASIFSVKYDIPEPKEGMSKASICCPNECEIKVVQTPVGPFMYPVCELYLDECKEVKGDADEECFCQCVEDPETFELKSECGCAKIIQDNIF